MKPLQWKSDTEFQIGDLRFNCLMGDYYADKTDNDHLVILKNRELITRLLDLYQSHNVKRAFEFGIFQGGSVMMLTEALGLERMAAIDFSEPIEALDAMIANRGWQDRVKLTYKVSQRDRSAVTQALQASFKPGEIDLIVDDCSHLYEHTKDCFEVAFPFLKPGGLYVIEDWGWAHWRGVWQGPDAKWRDRVAMSNLIFELVMTCASSPNVVADVTIWPAMAIIRKAPAAPVGGPFVLSNQYQLRNATLNQI